MRNIKLGFTLAEIGTALAVVGVMSALVLPLVTKNIRQQQFPALLGRTVEQIELGSQNMIQRANSRRLDGTYTDVLSGLTRGDLGYNDNPNGEVLNNLADIVPAYWGLNNEEIDNSDISIHNFSGGNAGTDANRINSSTIYPFSKLPADIAINRVRNTNPTNLTDDTGYVVYIDTNGFRHQPNRTGKDIFAFTLLNNGSLRAAIGTEAGNYAEFVVRNGFKMIDSRTMEQYGEPPLSEKNNAVEF